MFVTIINDCNDENAKGRQITRASSLFKCPINFIGVQNDIEAAGNIIDALDAAGEQEGILLVNVAPRSSKWKLSHENIGNGKKWKNGTPFGYFKYKNVLVVSTIDGYTLSLVKKLEIVDSIKIFDIPTVIKFVVMKNLITKVEADRINDTQFRSFDFSPRAAYWLKDEITLPSKTYSLSKIKCSPDTIWFVDNFGNCKTTLLEKDLSLSKNNFLSFYPRLKDVPDDKSALIIGSSGLGNHRFIEIIVQGERADDKYNLKLGVKLEKIIG